MLPRGLLAAALLHGAVVPCPPLPEHCIPGSVRRGRAGNDPAASHAGHRHPLPTCSHEKTRCEKFANNARTGDACSHDNSRDANQLYTLRLTGAMAAIILVVFSGIRHVKACIKSRMSSMMSLDDLIKVSKQTQTTILNAVSASTCEISMETASVLITCISDDLALFSREGRQALIDIIHSKTRRSHMGCPDNIDEQQATDATACVHCNKQSLYHIENYFTPEMWKLFSAAQLNREVLYVEIAKFLVQLGLIRPEEKFWGHLVGFIQWANEVLMDNPDDDINMLRSLWNEATYTMGLPCGGPTDYPVMPSMLMDVYPRVYARAYPGREEPILAPATKDIHSLNVLKASTGCRTSKAPSTSTSHRVEIRRALQRHHLALEAMLVLGKLCPQCRPGEQY
jgi:hypothetical protein